MKKILLFVLIITAGLFISCKGKKETVTKVPCLQGINLLPMYGRVEKCPEQLGFDQEFLSYYDKEGADKKVIATQYVEQGWMYIHKGDYDTAMKRLNQAWLLDSTNLLIYASFAGLLDMNNQPEASIEMLKLSFDKMKQRPNPTEVQQTNPNNAIVMELITQDIPFVYKKNMNLRVANFLNQALDTLNIDGVDNDYLKTLLQNEMNSLGAEL